MIIEDYVSFEIAKLLKEKGFDGDINLWYNENGSEIFFQQKYDLMYNWRVRQGLEIYQCPTLQMVMKWLRNVHDIDISIIPLRSHKEYLPRIESDIISHDAIPCREYEEAVEAAIKYCLENLI